MGSLVVPQPSSTTVVYASQLGCVMDGVTDNRVKLQRFLSTAAATNPINLVIDGIVATTGLVINPAGYTTISGLNAASCLFHLADQDNLIRLGPYLGTSTPTQAPQGIYSSIGAPPPIVARNVTITNLRLDGNYSANRVDTYRALIDFNGVANLVVRGCDLENNPWYGIRLGNCNGFIISDNRFYPIPETSMASSSTSQDGCHINGNSQNGTITGNLFHSVDDAIALNQAEGYNGPITNVTIAGNSFLMCPTWVRMYVNTAGGAISAISIASNSGSACAAGMIIGNNAASSAFGQMTGISFVGNEISAPTLAFVSDHVQLFFADNEWSGGIGGAVKSYGSAAITFEHIAFDGLQIIRTPTSTAQTSIFDDTWTAAGGNYGIQTRSGATTYKRASVRNVNVVDVGFSAGANSIATPMTMFATQAGTTISAVAISNIDGPYFSSFGTGGGSTSNGAVSGNPPLTMTFPDTNVANGTVYLSLSTSVPMVRLGGVSQILSPSGEASITSSTTAIPTNVELVTITLSANYSPSLAAGYAGQNIALQFIQDATGGRTVTYPTNVLGGMSPSATANKRSQQVFTYSLSQAAWIAQSTGVTGY